MYSSLNLSNSGDRPSTPFREFRLRFYYPPNATFPYVLLLPLGSFASPRTGLISTPHPDLVLLLPLGSFTVPGASELMTVQVTNNPSTPFREFPYRCFIYLFLSFSLWCFLFSLEGFSGYSFMVCNPSNDLTLRELKTSKEQFNSIIVSGLR